jgi:hypothetical protein
VIECSRPYKHPRGNQNNCKASGYKRLIEVDDSGPSSQMHHPEQDRDSHQHSQHCVELNELIDAEKRTPLIAYREKRKCQQNQTAEKRNCSSSHQMAAYPNGWRYQRVFRTATVRPGGGPISTNRSN